MRGSRNFYLAVISLGMILFAVSQSGYAQSQYRRGSNSHKESQLQNNSNKQQPQKPSYEHKPQQGKQPQQQVNRPQQGNRPQQQVNRPQQGNRPPQQANRPQQQRPGYAPPPSGHHRPDITFYPNGLRPRPSSHYYGFYVKNLPYRAKAIRRGAYDYYYVDGRYYRYINNVYVICRPPVGTVIAKSLLNGIISLTNYVIIDTYGRSQRCYTDYDGVYYIKSGKDYIVVNP
ncbi:MAG: hypothetical protein IKY70_00030, partial [Bacteroidales bacterium]|nr:hypothetical protein [Bacteroidales bacterium]